MLASKMPQLVKGAGFAFPGGNKPLRDDGEIFTRAMQAEKSLRAAVKKGIKSPAEVQKGLNPSFTSQFGLFLAAGNQSSQMQSFVSELNQILSAELGKNITLTSPLSSGFVPFDLLAPSRLIYPVYSPLRNKLPRTPGQGTSHRTKVINGIQGSQTAGSVGNPARLSMAEISSNTITSTWPVNIPAPGVQNAVDLNIPYQFFGRSESLSWLAQFAGQGFEDISALANLILLQEFMLGEEYQILGGTSASLAAPGQPTITARAAGSNETPVSGYTTNIYVAVTAVTYFGETAFASGSVASVAGAASVYDITVAPVRGAYAYNIYIGTGAAAPARTAFWLQQSSVGGKKFTLQGAIPTAGTNPPAADTGTAAATDYEGMLSILDGHAVTDASVYPAGWTGSYINKAVGSKLNHEVLYNALLGMWSNPNGTGNTSTTGAYRADPAELIAEGSDIARLSDEILNANSNSTAGGAFRLYITQDEVAGVRSGAAVSEFQNPITRSVVKIVVHPWLYQGTAFLQSYTLPMSWTNVANVWENVMVQDYLSVSWPVIDASFRYSMFMYGSLVCYAPQYCGVLQGLQISDTTPYM